MTNKSSIQENNEKINPEEEVSGLEGFSFCLQHLAEEALSLNCFRAASHLLFAADEINQKVLEDENDKLAKSLSIREAIVKKTPPQIPAT